MDQGQRERLERYFRNADRFMWGVIPGDKQTVFAALRIMLKELGGNGVQIPDDKKYTYATVVENLLARLGIERILNEIVTKQVKLQFAGRTGALDFLRAHWMSGTLPRWQTLYSLRARRTVRRRFLDALDSGEDAPEKRQQTSDILDAFVEVNTQYKYVHGWTVFAGLWFEDIEPLSKDTVENHRG